MKNKTDISSESFGAYYFKCSCQTAATLYISPYLLTILIEKSVRRFYLNVLKFISVFKKISEKIVKNRW